MVKSEKAARRANREHRTAAARTPLAVLEFPKKLSREKPLIEIAPSILSADFARLAEDANAAVRGGATLLHVDVMDGHFVPNITIGPPVVASLRKAVDVPLDCHLMIENPDEYIPAFADAGANWISVHQEACRHLNRSLELIRSCGARVGVVINPATTVQTLGEVLDIVDFVLVMSVNPGFGGQKFITGALEKVRKLATMRAAKGVDFRIEIDGVTVAESDRPHILFETGLPPRYYLPLTDVRMDLLRPSSTQSHCPYKGTASYWSLDTGEAVHEDIVWIYRTPLPESQKIAGLACFYNEKVDLYVDGELQERPRSPFS